MRLNSKRHRRFFYFTYITYLCNVNKVSFYVERDKDKSLWLYLWKPIRLNGEIFMSNKLVCAVPLTCIFKRRGLNKDDYKNLKCHIHTDKACGLPLNDICEYFK